MAKMGPDCCWGEDPVHPLPVVYQELAKLVLSNMDRLESKGDTATSKASKSGEEDRTGVTAGAATGTGEEEGAQTGAPGETVVLSGFFSAHPAGFIALLMCFVYICI